MIKILSNNLFLSEHWDLSTKFACNVNDIAVNEIKNESKYGVAQDEIFYEINEMIKICKRM